jgi:hypothetical protein
MQPEPNPPFVAAQDDSELEWLLCLASALQTRTQQAATTDVAPEAPPEAKLLQGLKELLKGPRRPDRIPVA